MDNITQPLLFDEWINKLPGEPCFGLRGSDPEAPATVLFWANLRRARLSHINPRDKKDEKDLAQCTEAEQIAWLMEEFQKGTMEVKPGNLPEELKEDHRTAMDYAKRIEAAIDEVQQAIVFYNQFDTIKPHIPHALKHLKIFADKLKSMYAGDYSWHLKGKR